jgi:spore coat protein H
VKCRWFVPLLVVLLSTQPLLGEIVYRIPQVANGAGAIRTTFVFLNNGTGDADVTLRLTDGGGEPMDFNIPGLDPGPTKSFSLPVGETRFFTSDGAGDGISVGAAVVESTEPIGVFAIFSILTDGGAALLTEAGVGAAVASAAFALAVDSEAPFDTGVALFNPGGEASEVTFRLFDAAGDPVGEPVGSNLVADGHLAVFVGGENGLFPTLGDFRGRLVVEATFEIAAVALRQKVPPGAPLTTLPVVPASSPRVSFHLSHIANGLGEGLGIKTQFIVFSLGAGGTVTLATTRGDGEPLPLNFSNGQSGSEVQLDLPAGGAVFMETDGQGEIETGAARVTSTVPVGVTAVLRLLDAAGNVTVEAGVGDSLPLQALTVPVDTTSGFDTGVALFNHNPEPANVTFDFFGPDGEGIQDLPPQAEPLNLVPFGHYAKWVGEIFDGLADTRGRMEIRSDRPLAAVSLRQGATTLTTLPVLIGDPMEPNLLASTGQRMGLEMNPEDLEELYSRDIWSEDRLPGHVRFNGERQARELIGLRFRGSSSRLLPKKSFNIRFERDQPLLFGSSRMNLNAMYTDPTMMREALSFAMFHELGWPAPRTRHFDLWINGIYEGTYIHIQRVDEWLLAMHGLNPDGTLVRDGFRDASGLARSAFGHDYSGLDDQARLELLRDNFDYRGDPAWVRLDEFIQWVRATPLGPQFAAGFSARVNVENFVDWLTVHWLIGDIDSWGDDYWMYLDHEDPDGRWHFIPWDKDLSFGSHYRGDYSTANDFFAYEYRLAGGWENLLISKVLATPELLAVIHTRLGTLMEEHFPPEWYFRRIDEMAERLEGSNGILPGPSAFVAHPRNYHGLTGRFHDQVESLRDFVELRRAFIQSQLAAGEGLIDQAEGQVAAGGAGKLFLTDDGGSTLATLEAGRGFTDGNRFLIRVELLMGVEGIASEWTLELDQPVEDLTLTLYYRNEVVSFIGRGENWYTGGDEAIGNQDRLFMEIDYPNGRAEALPTRVNPYSNKATATGLTLPAGTHRLRLLLPDS